MVFKRWHKSPSKKTPTRSWQPSEMKMIGKCMNKGISVSISPDWKDQLNRWKIDIHINGKTHTDPNRYENEDVYDKFLEYYKYYYHKINTNTKG
tara:strand:+ start:346 stop:627 length:282 start_codon:yes stop_codon:yes gene_type:complete